MRRIRIKYFCDTTYCGQTIFSDATQIFQIKNYPINCLTGIPTARDEDLYVGTYPINHHYGIYCKKRKGETVDLFGTYTHTII